MVYEEDGRTLEFRWKMAGSGDQHVVLAPLNLHRWTTPTTETVPVSKQLDIVSQLRDWLTNQGITSDLDRPQSAPADFDLKLLARE